MSSEGNLLMPGKEHHNPSAPIETSLGPQCEDHLILDIFQGLGIQDQPKRCQCQKELIDKQRKNYFHSFYPQSILQNHSPYLTGRPQ